MDQTLFLQLEIAVLAVRATLRTLLEILTWIEVKLFLPLLFFFLFLFLFLFLFFFLLYFATIRLLLFVSSCNSFGCCCNNCLLFWIFSFLFFSSCRSLGKETTRKLLLLTCFYLLFIFWQQQQLQVDNFLFTLKVGLQCCWCCLHQKIIVTKLFSMFVSVFLCLDVK